MSFNLKNKTVFLSLISVIALIITITFCVMVIIDSNTYGESFKNIALVVIGFFFNHEIHEKKELTNDRK